MRYAPISSELFVANRKRLRDLLLPNSLVAVNANDALPTNGDGSLGLCPNSDLFYLTGVEQEHTILVLYPAADEEKHREILFLREPTKENELWEGHKLTREEARELTGVAFELSDADASSLPMVEAGKGEPPALSVDDLLGPAGGDAVPADTLTMELPEFDLTALPEADAPAAANFESAQPAFPTADETVAELTLPGAAEPAMEALVTETASAAALLEFPPTIQTGEEFSGSAEARASEPMPESLRAPVGEFLAQSPAASMPAGPVADASVPSVPAGVSPSELAAMREAVTERVAHDLKRELGEKLLDRFEKIVWEVVPDLAEILITKEIERIRRLAEEEKPS